jgi:hypothetical protein
MPSYSSLSQTVQPNGSVAFDFDGHVSADGIDLLAEKVAGPVDFEPSTLTKIRWADVNGLPVAEVFAMELLNATRPMLKLRSVEHTTNAGAETRLESQGKTGSASRFNTWVQGGGVDRTSAGGTVSKSGGANSNDFTVMDSDGWSSFLQVLGDSSNWTGIGNLRVQADDFSFSSGLFVQGASVVTFGRPFETGPYWIFITGSNGVNLVTLSTGTIDANTFQIVWRWADGVSRNANISGKYLAIGQ